MTIRAATVDDIPVMVAMGSRFVASSSYRDVVSDNPAAMAELGATLIAGTHSRIFVSERGGSITGMLAMVVYAHPISGTRTAGEVFWWVEPSQRGDGLRLFRHAEDWAAEMGAEQIQMIAPTEQLERVYRRLGFQPVERIFQRPVKPVRFAPLETPAWPEPPSEGVQVVDGVLADPMAYREAALRGTFEDVPDAGIVFHGISRDTPSDEMCAFISRGFPGLLPMLTFLRQSPLGQSEPHVVHSDLSMGLWSAILYLTPNPAPGDGTAFWQRRSDGARGTVAATSGDYVADGETWAEQANWHAWYVVPAVFNRMVMFPSRLYHSRARENYGVGDDARLIQVAFGGFQ